MMVPLLIAAMAAAALPIGWWFASITGTETTTGKGLLIAVQIIGALGAIGLAIATRTYTGLAIPLAALLFVAFLARGSIGWPEVSIHTRVVEGVLAFAGAAGLLLVSGVAG